MAIEQPSQEAVDPAADLEAVRTASERIIATARRLDDDAVRQPSLLPGWSRGHVLTHVARNADALVNLLTWARTGEERRMYPSREARDAAIESGAHRPAAEIADDLEAACGRFLAAAAAVPPDRWSVEVVAGRGPLPAARLPWHRLREVEIHHVDLGLGTTPAAWTPRFAERAIDDVVATFRTREGAPALTLRADETGRSWRIGAGGPTVSGQEQALLAWLVGRASGDGLAVEPDGPLPDVPAWI